MAQHNETGNIGEQLARQYLEEKGFAIVETNWRRGKYEVDIIAYKEGLIVFAEVKTRSRQDYGEPEEFVTIEKQKAYVRLADKYVVEHNREEEVRFDIIAVEIEGLDYHITLLEDAFNAAELSLIRRPK
jgi:putative endonuclease